MRVAGGLLVALAMFAAGLVAGRLSVGASASVHYTTAPLRISSPTGESKCFIPEGTALYVDSTPFPEGFTRYRIYVNINGQPLASRPTERLWQIDPVTAFFDSGA